MLPNSVRQIEIDHSDHSIDKHSLSSLLKEFAVYGIPESIIKTSKIDEKHEGSTVRCGHNNSQILEHTSKLVFPSGLGMETYEGKEAFDKSMDIINISKEKLRSFVLTFEPTSFEKKVFKPPI